MYVYAGLIVSGCIDSPGPVYVDVADREVGVSPALCDLSPLAVASGGMSGGQR